MSINMPPAEMTRESALAFLKNGVTVATNEALPPEINARLATMEATAKAQCSKASPTSTKHVLRLLDVAMSAKTTSKRIQWHKKAADALSSAFAPFSACKAGCSHCCHIPVQVTESEAKALGQAIQRPPVPYEKHSPISITGYSSPCTFLVENLCSIYEHRPSVCRAHLNMDVDDLLCRLLPSGHPVPVPYVDTRSLQLTSLMLSGKVDKLADLRQWFRPATNEAKNDS